MDTNQGKNIEIYKIKLRKEIGQKIFNARKAKKMSRAALGEKIGLHETTIKKYEDGNLKNVKLTTIRDFAKALEIDMDELIDNWGITYPTPNRQTITVYQELIKADSETINNINKLRDFIHEELNGQKKGKYLFKSSIDEIINPYFEYESLPINKLFAITVNDDSIDKVAIQGMYAIIDLSHPSNGELGVIIVDNQPAVIREFYQYGPHTIGLKTCSNNPLYKHWLFDGEEEFERLTVLGTVIGFVTPRTSKLHSKGYLRVLYQHGEL